MDLSDEELIDAYLGGDEDAFPLLLQRHLADVYNFARRLGGGEDADDVTQEVFLKVWKNLKLYRRANAKFRTWLFSIARNTTIDFLRKKKHIAFSEFDTPEGGNPLTETLADETPEPDELFAQAESAQQLERALQALSPRAREVLLLRYREDLTFDEIGAVLKEPLNTVKSRHRRALAALRDILKKNQNGAV